MERAELLAKAKELGIEHDKRAKNTAIAALIETVTGEKIEITTKIVEPPKKEPVKEQEDGMIRCIIHSGDRDNDEVEVVGSVNGETYQAPIGIEIDFPVKFLPSIHGAVQKETIVGKDADGTPNGKKTIRWHKRYIIEKL